MRVSTNVRMYTVQNAQVTTSHTILMRVSYKCTQDLSDPLLRMCVQAPSRDRTAPGQGVHLLYEEPPVPPLRGTTRCDPESSDRSVHPNSDHPDPVQIIITSTNVTVTSTNVTLLD
jgi:hypothetical protein